MFIKRFAKVLLATTILCNNLGTVAFATGNTESKPEQKPKTTAEVSTLEADYVTTGTAPFEKGEGKPKPGEDYSDKDGYVRSFDEITYDLTVAVNEKLKTAPVVHVTAELPKINTADRLVIAWNTDNLPQGTYSLSNDKQTLDFDISDMTPGKMYTKGLVVNVYGANEGQIVQPTFKAVVKDSEDQGRTCEAKRPVSVSSKINFNAKLSRGSAHTKVEHEGVNGRLFQIGLMGSSISTVADSQKGSAFPEGPISVDIQVSTVAVNDDTKEEKDVVLDVKPYYIGYVGSKTPTGEKSFFYDMPYSKGSRGNSVTDTGSFTITKLPNKTNTFRVNFENYVISNNFPRVDMDESLDNPDYRTIPKNTLAFLSTCFELFVPFLQEEGNFTLNTTAQIVDVNYSSFNGTKYDTDYNLKDNKVGISYGESANGTFSTNTWIANKYYDMLETPYYSGSDAKLLPNQEFSVGGYIRLTSGADKWQGGGKNMVVFDGKSFEYVGKALVDYGGNNHPINDYKRYFGVADLTYEQIINARPDMFKWFPTLEEAKANETATEKICSVAVDIFEPLGYHGYPDVTNMFNLKVKSDAKLFSAIPLRTYGILYPVKDRSKSTGFFFESPYIPSEFDEAGNVIKGTNSPSGSTGGTTVQIIPYEVNIQKSVVDMNGDKPKTAYDLSQGNTVTWKIQPSVQVYQDTDVTDKITVTDYVPKGLNYIEGSASIQPISINKTDKGTELVWEYDGCPSSMGEWLPTITYKTEIPMNTPDRTQFETKAVISAPGDRRNESRFRTAKYTITVINDASFKIVKNVDKSLIDENEDFTYTLTWSNTSNRAYSNGKLLDILPFSNDTNGSKFTGSYTIEDFTIPNNTSIEYTNTDPTTIKDDALNSGVTDWQPLTKGVKATAIRVSVPTIEKQSLENVTLKIRTNGNAGNDIYKNKFSARVEGLEAKLISNIVETKVRTYALEGITWYDINGNGVINSDEPKLPNIPVSLVDEAGNPVLDKKGNKMTTTSNKEGHYQFEIFKQGKYRTVFELPSGTVPTKLMPVDNLSGNHVSLQTINGKEVYISEPVDVVKGYVYIPRLNLGVTPALSLKKSVDKSVTSIGDILTYTLTVTNNSKVGEALNNIPLEDTIPNGLEVVNGSISDSGTLEGNKIKWTINDLANGQFKTVTFKCKVIGEDLTSVKNVAVIPGTDIKDEVITPLISYSKSSDSATGTIVKEGQEITYSIKVDNLSDIEINNIKISDMIPNGTTLVKGSISDKGKLEDGTINWTIDSLASKTSKTVSFKVTANKLPSNITSSELRNIAVVNGNNTNEVIHPVKKAQLESIKECTVPSDKILKVGDEIGYSIKVTNTGESTSDKIIITDKVPKGTTLVENSISNGGSIKDGTITWELNPLEAKQTVTVSFKVVTNELEEGKTTAHIVNAAVVNGTTTNEVTNVVQVAKIQATKTSDPVSGSTVKVGDKIKYTIKVDNTGDATATDVKVKDTLPKGTSLVENSISNEGTMKDNIIAWNIPSINAKESATVSFEVIVGSLANGVYSSEIRNIALVNDVETNETIHYVKLPHLVINKSSNPVDGSTVNEGSEITYMINVSNTGAGIATNVSIKDIIPEGTTFVKANDNGKLNDKTVEWTVPEIKAGESKTVSFVVHVNNLPSDKTTGNIKNIATVNDVETNEVKHNVVVTRMVTEKTSSVTGTVKIGDKITYSIKLTNTGSSDIADIIVTDKLPSDTKLVKGSISNKGKLNKDTITWKIDKLKIGETITVKFTVKVLESAGGKTLTNVALVNNDKTNKVVNPVEVKPTTTEDKKPIKDIITGLLPQTGTLASKALPYGVTLVVIGLSVIAWKRFRK